MLIRTVEHNARAALLLLLEDINSQHAMAWGLVAIKRRYLKELSAEEIVLALKPALQEVTQVKIFFVENETIYVTWFGMPRQTCQKLTAACEAIMRPGTKNDTENAIIYIDPMVRGEELHVLLNGQDKKAAGGAKKPNGEQPMLNTAPNTWLSNTDLLATSAQIDQLKYLVGRKPARQKLDILIVEDQSFLRKLLSEVLRVAYDIDTASNVKEGWDLYLEKAPDIVFLDIQLPDGSGHALAREMKQIDPSAYIVMVTASNQRDDVEAAKKNHVDGFIIKPFNKKKITECIDNYLSLRNVSPKRINPA